MKLDLFVISALAVSLAAAHGCVTIQHDFPPGSGHNDTRAAAVVAEYEYVWAQYKQEAFGTDELLPLTHNGTNDLFGWGATIVDGLDTAVVMGLTDIAAEQLAWIASVDFSNATSEVDYFDAFIRYIGGLLSAYDLIHSDLVPDGTYDSSHVDALLQAAITISNKIKVNFDTPSGLPMANTNFTTGVPDNGGSTTVDTATTGTLILEWFRLSDITGDSSYSDLAVRCEANLVRPNQTLLYPYLVGSSLDINTGDYLDFAVGWEGGIDSFYEYLIKTYIYDPTRAHAGTYKDFWVGAVESTSKYLALHPYGRPELTFISEADENGTLVYGMDDYACFAGGNMLLGGQYLANQSIMDLGLAVTDSCHATYNTSTAGLNPFFWSWFNGTNQTYNTSYETDPAAVAYADRAGFFVVNPFWGSFPEPIESMFYAYRITGETIWQDYVWDAFENMLNDTRNRGPNVTMVDLEDVTQPYGGPPSNEVPSFFFAEVLKYMYLTFVPPDVVSLDEWVFNTECHPFKIQGGTCATS